MQEKALSFKLKASSALKINDLNCLREDGAKIPAKQIPVPLKS